MSFSILRKTVRATGGTETDEFAAKIKSVTSATTVGAVFVYDTRNDSDSGAWRKKCAGLSWYDETLNTATRGGRREFPSVALIVADGASPDTVSLYDLDDPAAPLWLQFKRGTASWTAGNMGLTDNNVSSVFALNGRIYIGQAAGSALGVEEISFVDDTGYRYTASATAGGYYNGNISERLDGKGWAGSHSRGNIVNGIVNDVAATVLEGAEIGALGLPIPTVAVATDGGVSVIHPNGDVYDIAGTGQTHDDIQDVFFTDDGMVGYNYEASGSVTHSWSISLRKIPFADGTIGSYSTATNLERYNPIVNGNVSGLTTQASEYNTANAATRAVTPTSKNGLAIGYADRLSIVKRNPANMEEGAVAYITSQYTSGYQIGDSRLAVLGGYSSVTDRSVKGNNLTQTGTIVAAAVATDAELSGYSNFSASNYLSRAYDADFDFGTGDFSISLWVKNTDWSGDKRLLGRSESTTAKRLSLYASGTTLTLYLRDGADTLIYNTNVLKNNVWQHVFAFRKSSKLYLYVDGRSVATPVASTTNITPTSAAALVIGAETFDNLSSISNPLTNGSLSLVRISATAPTPQQVKEIYEAEAPLFRSGAKCLLKESSGETHGSPSAVNGLSYDDSTGLLWTTQNSNLTSNSVHAFRGLERVDTFDLSAIGLSGNTQHVAAQSGIVAPVREASSGGAGVSIPAIDVRGDINTADSKLPDDGKLHFTGTTPNATPVVIGQIPIAADEKYRVIARVIGCRYQNADSSHRIIVDIAGGFTRTMTGDVVAEPLLSKLSEVDSSASTLDVEFDVDTSADTIRIKVTGFSAFPVEWKATVEVIRITERSYER